MKDAHKVHKYILYSLLLTLCAAILIGGTALAAGEVLTRSAITIAGGQATVNGIESRSAVGQPVAGIINSGVGDICTGLMCPGSGSTQGVPQITPTATPAASTTPNPSQTPGATGTPSVTPIPGSTNTPSATPIPGSQDNNLYLPLVTR